MPVLLPAQLEVFYGATDPAAAHVYVRWPTSEPEELRRLSLGGTIRGPFNHLARTLPATVPLADQGPGESLLARAILPDPCYWVPGAPYLYTAHVAARDGRRVVAEAEHTLGIRPLGAAGRRFKLAGKGWLPRAIHRDLLREEDADDFAAWRELGAVMIARSPTDDLCRQASEQGVLIFAEGLGQDATTEIRRLGQWAAVGMIFLSEEDSLAENPALARNLFLAREITAEDQFARASRAHGLLVSADAGELLARAAQLPMPVLAARRCARSMPLAEARAACDELQAELAGRIDVAGLVMSPPQLSS